MDAWANVKIRESVAERIDLFIGVKNEYGAVDFDSRASVVEAACVEFLKRHKAPVVAKVKVAKVKA